MAVRESLLTLVNIETLAPITRVPVLVAHTPEVKVFVVAVGIRVTVREPSRTLVEFYSTINIIQARRRRAHKENVTGTESVLNAGFDIAIFSLTAKVLISKYSYFAEKLFFELLNV